MTGSTGRRGRRRLVPLIALLVIATVVLVGLTVTVVSLQGDDPRTLFADVYESTGSRLTGLVSAVGVVLLAIAATVCVFTARLVSRAPGAADRSRWLRGAGLITALLALDDYLAIHEFADDIMAPVLGVESGRVLKNLLEAGVLGIYALLLAGLFWRFRRTVRETDWLLAAIGAVLLAGSLAMDLAPHRLVAETIGLSIEAQDVIEDTLKVMGIAFYATYLLRAAWQAARAAVVEAH